MKGRIILRPLSDTVSVARVWRRLPSGAQYHERSYRIYFVRDPIVGAYVSAVLEMDAVDLHTYTLKRHRRQGHMYRALRDWILPDLFSDDREEQRVTFQSRAGRDLFLKLGFQEDGVWRATLKAKDLANSDVPLGMDVPLSKDEYQELRADILRAAGVLQMSLEKLEAAYGPMDSRFEATIWDVRELSSLAERAHLDGEDRCERLRAATGLPT